MPCARPGRAVVLALLTLLGLGPACLDGQVRGGLPAPGGTPGTYGPTGRDAPIKPPTRTPTATTDATSAEGDAKSSTDTAPIEGGAEAAGETSGPVDGGGHGRIDAHPKAPPPDAAPADPPVGPVPIDCGESGVALEAHGPAINRVNYVILGDGYVAKELDTTYLAHVRSMIAALFSEQHEPYGRYRRFLNICVLKVASNQSGVDGDGRVRDTAFDGRGDDRSRLGVVNGSKVRAAIARLLPQTVDVDWRSVVLNSNQWWHSGGAIMVWSGGGDSRSAEAAVHEGGHSFHRLADEYDHGSCRGRGEPTEINVSADPMGQLKWKEWLGFVQMPGTGLQRPVQGGRYCRTGIYRPSNDSLMRSIPGSFNAISREKVIRDIYAIVSPIDGATDPREIPSPPELTVKVVDPTVVKVEWSVDDQVVNADGGETFPLTGLAPGTHTVSARAYDDTPWVRGDRSRLQKSVKWTVTLP